MAGNRRPFCLLQARAEWRIRIACFMRTERGKRGDIVLRDGDRARCRECKRNSPTVRSPSKTFAAAGATRRRTSKAQPSRQGWPKPTGRPAAISKSVVARARRAPAC